MDVTTTTTPSTTTETTSVSAPSVSAETTPAKTWDEAYARVDAAAATAAPATPETDATATDPASADAIAPPVPAKALSDDSPIEDVDTLTGMIPATRVKASLKNARDKGKLEAEATFKQQYAGHLQIGDALRANLPGTLGQLLDEALTHPDHGAAVKAMLGAKLRGLRQPPASAAPAAEAEPSLFVEQNGERYFDPDALPKWQAWQTRQLKSALEQQFAPLTALQSNLERAQAIARFQEESRQTVEQRLAHWMKQPGFVDHKAQIATRQRELFEQGGMDEWTALGLAYAEVVPPKLAESRQSALSARAVAQAAGRTDNPAATVPSPPRRPKSWDEAYAQQGLS
jgi:hypothetical protein